MCLPQVNMRDTIKEELHANCRVCHTAGALFDLRPLCSRCKCACVLFSDCCSSERVCWPSCSPCVRVCLFAVRLTSVRAQG